MNDIQVVDSQDTPINAISLTQLLDTVATTSFRESISKTPANKKKHKK
jgi:hypothetical protein